jgi:hypothetical protein
MNAPQEDCHERRLIRPGINPIGPFFLLSLCLSLFLIFPLHADAQQAPNAPTKPTPEEVEERERLLQRIQGLGYVQWDENVDTSLKGVTRHDRTKAWQGYTLYANEMGDAYLLDMDGKRVHAWKFPETAARCEYAELFPDGNLAGVCVGNALVLLDWNSNVIFQTALTVHHDIAVLPQGGFLVPYNEKREFNGRTVLFDGIARVSPSGQLVRRWSFFHLMDALKELHSPSPLDKEKEDKRNGNHRKESLPLGLDYYHVNTIEVLPESDLGKKDRRFRQGNLLVCLRNVDLIAVLDQDDHSVLWHWGPGELQLPHMPTLLPNGHILVFDNGAFRGWSRILELDPLTNQIVWKYETGSSGSFFTRERGSNQRLENGNTLICESARGRIFEVTRQGEIVWEFWNPEIRGSKRRRIYRAMRLSPALVDPLLKSGKSILPGS